jgi:predicted lipoprotein with Yx(FWY)xxD motif
MRRLIICTTLLLVMATASATPVLLLAGPASAHVTSGTVVKRAFNHKLGRVILVTSKGLTLYLHTTDSARRSRCYSSCATIWQPLRTSAAPVAGRGVNKKLLGTIRRRDGRRQVTYNHHPLYTDAGRPLGGPGPFADLAPGDIFGQGYKLSWYAVSPAGRPIRRAI